MWVLFKNVEWQARATKTHFLTFLKAFFTCLFLQILPVAQKIWPKQEGLFSALGSIPIYKLTTKSQVHDKYELPFEFKRFSMANLCIDLKN